MRALTVYLDYASLAPQQSQRDSSLGVALPVNVLDAQGTVLAEGLASSSRPAEFKLPEKFGTVFVRLTWPSGRTESQRAVFLPSATAHVTFSDAKIIRNEWSAWAIPRLNPRISLAAPDKGSSMSITRYENVWLRVWRFDNGEWSPIPMAPRMQYKSDVAKQVDLELEARPHLLQIGGSETYWRFVALPGGGPCRVLLTPNDSKDPLVDPLKVVVTSCRSDAETLLEFLARDAIRAATTMANSTEIAFAFFEEKLNDPISAVAGAYYLLRIEAWDRVPLNWWKNLSGNFEWIPDTAILHCIRLLRAGLGEKKTRIEALNLFKACLDRGWPVYEEGLQLLQEAGSLLRSIASRRDAEYFARVETLATAKTRAGAAFSFYGRVPSKPSAVLWVGMPNAPRRWRLAQPEWVGKLIVKNLHVVKNTNHSTASGVSRQMSSLSFAQEFAPKKVTRLISSSSSAGKSPSLEFVDMSVGSFSHMLQSEAEIERPKESKKRNRKSGDWMLLGDIGS